MRIYLVERWELERLSGYKAKVGMNDLYKRSSL